MLSRFIFDNNLLKIEEKDFYSKCKFVEIGSNFKLENSCMILDCYFYYEAIQELIIIKALKIKEKDFKDKKIESLKKLQMEIQKFQECALILLFKDIFENLNIKTSHNKTNNFSNEEALEKMWDLLLDEESVLSEDEVLTLHNFFNSFNFDKLNSNMKDWWINIIEKYKEISRG